MIAPAQIEPDRSAARKQAFRRAVPWILGVLFGALLAGWVIGFWLGALVLLAGIVLILHRLKAPAGVPVLVYHSVSPDAGWLPWGDNISVRPETLRLHLETLERMGRKVISTSELITTRMAGGQLAPGSVVIHFDDGYLDNYLFAAPLLQEFQTPATIFASIDFIEPGEALRDSARDLGTAHWRGYMTGAELRALDADPLFEIESHGIDHARIPVSDQVVDVLGPENWRRYAQLGWAVQPGNKARWYESREPQPPMSLGQNLPRSDSALSGKWFRKGRAETDAEFATRIEQYLATAFQQLEQILGRPPRVFCWPFDRCLPLTIDLARKAGFAAVTGGRGENRAGEPAHIISRVHMQDYAFGIRADWLEALALRARLRTADGALAWHLVTVLAARLRRRRFRASGYAGAAA